MANNSHRGLVYGSVGRVRTPWYSLQHHINPVWSVMPVTPALGWQSQKVQKFRVVLGYVLSSEPPWAMWDPVPNQIHKNKKFNKIKNIAVKFRSLFKLKSRRQLRKAVLIISCGSGLCRFHHELCMIPLFGSGLRLLYLFAIALLSCLRRTPRHLCCLSAELVGRVAYIGSRSHPCLSLLEISFETTLMKYL